jgi:DNA-binding MarR family transcriptional regulator
MGASGAVWSASSRGAIVISMFETLDLDDSVALADELRPILLRLARHLRTEVRLNGLTAAQHAILIAVEFNPGVTGGELSEREGMSGAAVSGHLARLEGRGVIRRERLSDRRGVGVFLTPLGSSTLASVRQQRNTWLSGRLRDLGRDDRELIKASLHALDRIALDDR